MPFHDVTSHKLIISLNLKCSHPLFPHGRVFQYLPSMMHRNFSLAAIHSCYRYSQKRPHQDNWFWLLNDIGHIVCLAGLAIVSWHHEQSIFPHCKGQKRVGSLFVCLSDICAHLQNCQGSWRTDMYVFPIFIVDQSLPQAASETN